jgi:hypothetical protein
MNEAGVLCAPPPHDDDDIANAAEFDDPRQARGGYRRYD